MTAAPIIVSALFKGHDFSWLNGLRKAHFPPERNQLDAHLTLFHHLPPSIESELRRLLVDATKRLPPRVEANGLINLGRGVAIRLHSSELAAIREYIAEAFCDLLTPQDAGGWRPHVTIQNKVRPDEARALYLALAQNFRPRFLQINALAAWWYRDGPWELISRHPFR